MDGVAATAAVSGGCGGKVRSAAATGVVESGGTAKPAANEGAKGSELERVRILGGEATPSALVVVAVVDVMNMI